MNIPNILNDANIYVDGANWLGKAEVTLPEIAQEMKDYKAFGISGTVEVPIKGHVGKMEGTIKFKSMTADAANILYDPSHAPMLDVRAAIQKYDPATGSMQTYPVKVTLRAFFKKVKLIDFKQASDADNEISYTAHYFKLEIDGKEIVEIDQFNYIYKVNGKDIMADVRSAIGV